LTDLVRLILDALCFVLGLFAGAASALASESWPRGRLDVFMAGDDAG
jgi:hypothetical protein